MVTRRELYERVNTAWPEVLPVLTFAEAQRAARKLYRYATGKKFPYSFVETSGNRSNWVGRRNGTRVFRLNPERGWKIFVHHFSHWLHRVGNPDEAPHAKAHARLERRLILQVLRRGWLDGTLREEETPAPAPAPTPNTKLDHARTMLARAETRLKRATTLRRKWARRVRLYERKLSSSASSLPKQEP